MSTPRLAPRLLGISVVAVLGVLAVGARDARTQSVDAEHVVPMVVDRTPVILVPGWDDSAEQLEPLRRRFVEAGWPETHVMAIGFEVPEGSNVTHAGELADSIARLLARSHADRADVVAHSMGGLATRHMLKHRPEVPVRRAVFIASPHRGTLLAWAAWGEGGKEMHPGSAFLLDLEALRGVPAGIEALTIRSKTDMHIIPNSSATLPGVPDVEVCCPSHAGLLDDRPTFDAALRFLLREP